MTATSERADPPSEAGRPEVPAGRHFEDFIVGQEFVTQGRTITETDLMMYAYVSGDHNPLHTNAEFAKHSGWAGRLVYGLLVTLIGAGLRTRLGLLDGTALALLNMECRFVAPVFLDDTVMVRVRVEAVRPTRHADRGIVTLDLTVVNQRDEVVQEGTVQQLVRRQQPGGETADSEGGTRGA